MLHPQSPRRILWTALSTPGRPVQVDLRMPLHPAEAALPLARPVHLVTGIEHCPNRLVKLVSPPTTARPTAHPLVAGRPRQRGPTTLAAESKPPVQRLPNGSPPPLLLVIGIA